MVPECPVVAPLVPSDPQVLDVDPVFHEHLADLAPCHAGGRVAVHDDGFATPKCFELSDDPVDLVVGGCGGVRVGRDVDGTDDVFLLVLLLAPEIHQDIVTDAFVHLAS